VNEDGFTAVNIIAREIWVGET